MTRLLRVNGAEHEVRLDEAGGAAVVRVGGHERRLRVREVGPGVYAVETGGRVLPAHVARDRGRLLLHVDGHVYEIEDSRPRAGTAPRAVHHDMRAPMTAMVAKLLAAAGDRVQAGQPLVVLEAMKMEMTVRASRAGVVARLPYAEGEVVEGGEIVAEVDDAGPA